MNAFRILGNTALVSSLTTAYCFYNEIKPYENLFENLHLVALLSIGINVYGHYSEQKKYSTLKKQEGTIEKILAEL